MCVCVCVCVCIYSIPQSWEGAIGLMSRVFSNGLEDQGSIAGQVIPKTQKIVLDPPCLTLSIIR